MRSRESIRAERDAKGRERLQVALFASRDRLLLSLERMALVRELADLDAAMREQEAALARIAEARAMVARWHAKPVG